MCQLQHYRQIRCGRPLPLPTRPISKSRRTSAELSQQQHLPTPSSESEPPKICLATLTPSPTLIKCDWAKLLATPHFNICWEPTPVLGGAIEAPDEIKEHARDKCRSCHYTTVPTRLSLDEMNRGLSCRTSPPGKKNELRRSKSGMGRLMERVKSHHHGLKKEREGSKEKENDKGKGKVVEGGDGKEGGGDGELEGFIEVNAGRW